MANRRLALAHALLCSDSFDMVETVMGDTFTDRCIQTTGLVATNLARCFLLQSWGRDCLIPQIIMVRV